MPEETSSPPLDSEPTRIVASILALGTAINGLLTLTKVYPAEVGGSIMLVFAAAVSLGGELVRSKVWSRKSVTGLVKDIAEGAPAVMPPE